MWHAPCEKQLRDAILRVHVRAPPHSSCYKHAINSSHAFIIYIGHTVKHLGDRLRNHNVITKQFEASRVKKRSLETVSQSAEVEGSWRSQLFRGVFGFWAHSVSFVQAAHLTNFATACPGHSLCSIQK